MQNSARCPTFHVYKLWKKCKQLFEPKYRSVNQNVVTSDEIINNSLEAFDIYCTAEMAFHVLCRLNSAFHVPQWIEGGGNWETND